MGYVSKKNFKKNIFVKQNLLLKFCKQIKFEPCLDHSRVTTVFDLET